MEDAQAYEAYLDKVALDISMEFGIFSSFVLENRDSLDLTEVAKHQIKGALRTAYMRGLLDAAVLNKKAFK